MGVGQSLYTTLVRIPSPFEVFSVLLQPQVAGHKAHHKLYRNELGYLI